VYLFAFSWARRPAGYAMDNAREIKRANREKSSTYSSTEIVLSRL